MKDFLRTMISDIRQLPGPVWVLVGGQFINRFGSFVNPFLALFLSGRNMTMGHVAVVLGSISIGQLMAQFASGYCTDAFGRRNTILISLIGGAISMLAIYFFESYPALIAVAMIHGLFAFMFGPAANALMSDLVTQEQRVTAFAMLRLAINAGFAAGPAVAGFLFTRAPMLIFIGDAATTLLFALLALFFLPHGLRTVSGDALSWKVVIHSWRDAVTDAWQNRPFVQLVFGTLCMAIAFVQTFNVLSLDAKERGLDPVHYGVLMGFNGFLIMIIELPLTQLIKKLAPKPVLFFGFALVGIGCAGFALGDSMTTFMIAMAVFTIGEMLSLPVASGYASKLAPVKLRGRYFGIYGLVWGLAGLTGSSGVWFYGHIGHHWWLWTGAIGLLAGVVMLFNARDRRPAYPAATPNPA